MSRYSNESENTSRFAIAIDGQKEMKKRIEHPTFTALIKAFFIAGVFCLAVGSANATVVYSQNFDGPAPSSLTTSGLWHITSNFPDSSPNALGYVQNETPNSTNPDGNYDTGAANSGTASLTGIVLPTSGPSILTFDAFNHNEFINPAKFDYLTLSVGGSILASSATNPNSPGYASGAVNIPYWTGTNVYNPISVDLTALDGQTISLDFGFNTLDATDNNNPGARVDNVLITNAVPEPGALGLMAAGLAFLGLILGRRRPALR